MAVTVKAGSEKLDFVLPYALTRTLTYTVTDASPTATVYDVVDTAGLPLLGATDGLCIVTKKQARETESRTTWEVDVTAVSSTTQIAGKNLSPAHFAADPASRPAEKSWYTVHYDRVVTKDTATGVKIRNSAGDPYDPPLTEDYPVIGLSYTRFQTYFYPRTIAQYVNRVASDSFYGFLPGEARCVEIDCQDHYENGYTRYKVTYKFEFDLYINNDHPGKWVNLLLNAGGRYKNDAGDLVVADDDEGLKHGGLILLDNFGKKLAPNANPVYHWVNSKFFAAFSSLGIT